MNDLDLQQARYVSLVTFRKSGKAVPTPVWAAFEDGGYHVFSAGDAGKVKRLRSSDGVGRARLAKCDARGKLLGEYHEAQAEIVDDAAGIERALKALRSKYGFQMRLADVGAKLTGRFGKRAYIRVVLSDAGEQGA